MNESTTFPLPEAHALESSTPKNSTRPMLVGLLVMLLLMSAGMGVEILQLRHMASTLDVVVREGEAAREAINTINRAARARTLLMAEVLGQEDPFDRDEKLLEFDRLASGIAAAQVRLGELSTTAEGRRMLARQHELIAKLIGVFDQIVDSIRRDDMAAASEQYRTLAIPTQGRMLDTLMQWEAIQHRHHDNKVRAIQTQQLQIVTVIFGVALIAILIGLLMAVVVYRLNNRLIGRFIENETRLRATLAELAFRQQAMDAHSIVSEADVEGRITQVNDRFCEISGYTQEELIGANHRIVKSDLHPPEFFQDMWETIGSGRIWHGEVRNRSKSGQHYWVATTIVPMLDENGLPVRYISVRTEITNIMEMEEAVRQANVILRSNVIERTHELELAKEQLERELQERGHTLAALQQSHDELKKLHRQLQDTQQYLMQSEKLAAVGQLAAGMAHEINNPVSFVTSNLTTLSRYQNTLGAVLLHYRQLEAKLTEDLQATIAAFRKETDLDFVLEDTRALLDESLDGVERVRKIVQDLRDFSRVDSAGQWQRVDLNHCLDTTLSLIGERIPEGVTLHHEYGRLPLVECNPADLNQVFINLLNNALQAVPENGNITVRSGVEGSQVWVEIEDTGEGISAEVLPHIFEPFFTTRPVGQGAGLGLSMAYGVMQQHGGHIDVQSRVGLRSVFRVTLPVSRSTVDFPAGNEVSSAGEASHA